MNRKPTSLFAAVTLALSIAAPAAQAAYGPENPSPVVAPGGFTQVVTSRVLGRAGGTIHGALRGLGVTVTVPQGEFRSRVQVVLVSPQLRLLAAALRRNGFPRARVVGGVGLGVNRLNGNSVESFARPISMRLAVGGGASAARVTSVSRTGRRAIVVRYDQASHGFARVMVTRTGHTLTVSTRAPGAFAVLLPRTAQRRALRRRSRRPHSRRGFTG